MKIICIGRNYAAHIEELKNEQPAEPVVFIKPDSAILVSGNPFFLPDFSQNIHYELELIVRIDRLGKNIQQKFAHKYYNEIGLGIDFTARDLQDDLKKKGLPWEKSKAFDGSAVIGAWISKNQYSNINNLNFELRINGLVVQQGVTSLMLYSIDSIIEEVSKYFTLKIGDIIFTGTPSGVGQVHPNDLLEGYLEGKKCIELRVK